jgi:aspartate racemase
MKKESPNTFRLVGILGGMGPAATADLMHKVVDSTPATHDQGHVPLVVWSVPQIPDRAAAIRNANAPSPAPEMCRGAVALAHAGAEAIAIACNTAHFWASDIQAATGLRLLHIADAALNRVNVNERTMLLATEGTREAGIYEKPASERGLQLELPDTAMQEAINQSIALVKANNTVAAQTLLAPYLVSAQKSGVTTFLLACTELPLVIQGTPFEAKSLDATRILARAIVAFSRGDAA